MQNKYVILGAGGFAREVCLHIQDYEFSIGNKMPDFIFVDDVTEVKQVEIRKEKYNVVKNWKFPQGFCNFIIGIGSPLAKRIMVEKAIGVGLIPCKTVIHPRAFVQDAFIGLGGIITPGVAVTTNVIIGDYVILNLNTTVGHDTVIGDFVTCNPLCSISGNVVLEEASFVGVGASVLEKKKVGRNAVVGAQACVVKNVPDNETHIGIPAKKM